MQLTRQTQRGAFNGKYLWFIEENLKYSCTCTTLQATETAAFFHETGTLEEERDMEPNLSYIYMLAR